MQKLILLACQVDKRLLGLQAPFSRLCDLVSAKQTGSSPEDDHSVRIETLLAAEVQRLFAVVNGRSGGFYQASKKVVDVGDVFAVAITLLTLSCWQ